MSSEQLVRLVDTLGAIEIQIRMLENEADLRNILVHELRLPDGSWPMIPLLLAKSNILLAQSQETNHD